MRDTSSLNEDDAALSLAMRSLVHDVELAEDSVSRALRAAARRSRRPGPPFLAGVGVLAAVAVVLAGLLLPHGGRGVAVTHLSTTAFDPIGLVGRWSVQAAGEEKGAILRVSDDMNLFVQCGELFATWAGSGDGQVAVTVNGWSGACGAKFASRGAPTWLTTATSARTTAEGVDLLATDGHVLAHLTPGPAPSKRRDTLAPTDVPIASQALITRLHNTARLPTDLRPATATQVIGQWRPDPQTKAPASLTVEPDGTWVSNDGCNDSGGQWRMSGGGTLTATAGNSSKVGCAGSSIPGQWGQARRIGFNGATMVLIGADGTTIGTLVPDTTPPCTSGQLTATRQPQGFGGNGLGASDGMAVILNNNSAPCLFSDTVTVTTVDQAGTPLASSTTVTSSRPALIAGHSGQTHINVNANYGKDLTTGTICTDDRVKPYALHLTGTELGDLTVPMDNSLRTCKGQLSPQGFVESFGG